MLLNYQQKQKIPLMIILNNKSEIIDFSSDLSSLHSLSTCVTAVYLFIRGL